MQVLDVREFGAKGDSIHDDGPALCAAWAAAQVEAESEAPPAPSAQACTTPEHPELKAASVGP